MDPQPKTQTDPELQPESDLSTLADACDPGIVLIEIEHHLGVLLARDVVRERRTTHLLDAHWIRLPLGWKTAAADFLIPWRQRRMTRRHFDEVVLRRPDDVHIAQVLETGQILPQPSALRYAIKRLTPERYEQLLRADAREIRRLIRKTFEAPTVRIRTHGITAPPGYASAAPQ